MSERSAGSGLWRAALTAAAAVVVLLVACGPDTAPPVGPRFDELVDGSANVLVTTGDRSKLLSMEPRVPVEGLVSDASLVITVDASQQFQELDGVGAALTGSSAAVIDAHLTAETRRQVINDLFGPFGARLGYVRVPLSSTDFSNADYTYDDLEIPRTDPDLEFFSLARDDATLIPILREAAAVNPDLLLMGSPWTAPGWMKVGNDTNRRKGLLGGTLADEWTGTYATYLRRVVSGYAERGVSFDAITVQNEPAYAPPDYPGMLLGTGQEARLAAAISAEFDAAELPTKVVVHDHNWDLADRARAVLDDPALDDPMVDRRVAGSAFHCYRGSPTAQSSVKSAFPDKDLYFTECSGTESSGTFSSNLLWNARVLLVGATRNWARTVLLWNLALDERHGPRVGGCADCRGVITIDSRTGEVTRNEEFYALAQFSRGVDSGARRIWSSGAVGPSGTVQNVAVLNPDGSTTVLLVNSGTTEVAVSVVEADSGDAGQRRVSYDLPPASVVTLRWR